MNDPRSPETVSTTVEKPNLRSVVNKTANYIARKPEEGGISKADLADLRRINPDRPFTPALWKILLTFHPNDEAMTETRERQWAVLLMAMATCRGLHTTSTPFGTALAEAGWSELRFVRLLNARGDNLVKEMRRLAKYLANKNEPADWADAAWLLFVQDGETAENIRQDIARRYYKRRYTKENQDD